MKKLLTLLALSIILFCGYTFAQTDETCGTIPAYYKGESIDLNQKGGIYLTAQGELKVLVVFARFKDDISAHPYWPTGQPPDNYTTFIDPNLQTNSTHYINLTHYFKKMSLGVYKVTGQAVYVETPQNKSYYFSQPNPRFAANKDVLQNKVDPLINFADYDNWSCSSNYNHIDQPDGTVDMIIMIWRGFQFSSWWSGEASLGYGGSFTVENATKTIKTSFGGNAGSGVTVHYLGARSPERSFKVTVHEIAHWLLGGSHPYGGGNDQHRVWGMLTRGDDGICANTYERERVAWINPTAITGDVFNAPFLDYVEYGAAYKYHSPSGATNEHYYFENHQKINIYDDATSYANDKGIFVIHQQNIYSESNNIRVKTSNGQWNWENPFNTTCWNVTVPAFKPTTVNRAGLNNRNMLPKSGGGAEWLFALINESGTAVCGDWLHGGGLNNSFSLSYSDVFSPYSNPYTHTWSNSQNNFTMEVIEQNGSVVNAQFYLTNPLAGKPSKPMNLQVVQNISVSTVLSWAANLEPDVLTGGGYKIHRWTILPDGSETNYTLLTPSIFTTTTFTDNNYEPITGLPKNVDLYHRYRITAVDTQGKESVKSEYVDAYFTHVASGTISSNKTLMINVNVLDDVTVQNGVTLTINPSTRVVFENGKTFTINGKLIAKGTPTQRITFTSANPSPSPGYWGGDFAGIFFNGSGPDTLSY